MLSLSPNHPPFGCGRETSRRSEGCDQGPEASQVSEAFPAGKSGPQMNKLLLGIIGHNLQYLIRDALKNLGNPRGEILLQKLKAARQQMDLAIEFIEHHLEKK